MVWFTGTSTGDRYNVGQSYESAGRVYTARVDGGFREEGTNRVLVGSSQDPTTQWGGWSTPAVGSGAASYDGTAGPSYGGGAAAGQVYSSPSGASPVHTTGPGNRAAQNDAPVRGGGAAVSTVGPGRVGPVITIDPNNTSMNPDSVPLERIGDGGPQESWGAVSDIGFARTATGWVPIPSRDTKESIEDSPLEWSWFTRNYLTPMFIGGMESTVRPEFLDPAYSHYVPILNEWRAGTQTRPTGYRTGGGF